MKTRSARLKSKPDAYAEIKHVIDTHQAVFVMIGSIIVFIIGEILYGNGGLMITVSTFTLITTLVALVADNVILNSLVAPVPIIMVFSIIVDAINDLIPSIFFHAVIFFLSLLVLIFRIKRISALVMVVTAIYYQFWVIAIRAYTPSYSTCTAFICTDIGMLLWIIPNLILATIIYLAFYGKKKEQTKG